MWTDLQQDILEEFSERAQQLESVIWKDHDLVLRADPSKTPEGNAAYLKKYFQTPAGKAARARYNASAKGQLQKQGRAQYFKEYRARKKAEKAQALRVADGAADRDAVDGAGKHGRELDAREAA